MHPAAWTGYRQMRATPTIQRRSRSVLKATDVMAKPIKCAKCNVALEGPAHPRDDDILSCPRCGQGDTFKKIMAEINDYVADQAAREMFEAFKRVTRGRTGKQYKEAFRPQK